ncbi:MAG: motility accessory factor Maf-2, partial [Aeromonas sp.]
MQIQQTRPGGVAETPAQPKLHGRPTAQASSPQISRSDRQPNVIRLDRWALIGTAQQRIAHAQGGEQALSQVWGELKRLEQQLSQNRAA